MSILAEFWGFIFGAALGTIATATTGKELRTEAKRWLASSRWRTYLKRETWRFPGALSAALDLLQIEILALLLFVWFGGLFWLVFFTPTTWADQSYVRYIVGSLVGTAAAPWIWLHFSRTFATKQSKGDVSAESDQLARYRFVSYMLGAALLLATLQPYLAQWLPHANKIEGFGVALTFVQSRNERGLNILQAGQPTTKELGATTSRLSSATSRARMVAIGYQRKTLKDVTANMERFSDLSVMDRDRVYIAYFQHERNAQRGQPTLRSDFSNLHEYVEATKNKIDQASDEAFLAGLADLSECISLYAENLRDFRLFLVDSNDFLRALLVDVASKWSAPGPQQVAASKAATLELKSAKQLADQIVAALEKFNVPAGVCDTASKLTNKTVALNGVGKTPYPAYLIAHYMAAIDSVETGVLILRDWLYRQRSQSKADSIQNDPEQGWYAIRAMLTSSQLPYRFGSVSPTHRALVKFQQDTTDRIAALLKVHDARAWRALCKRLDDRGLHAQIGRYLALTYADERNYLFELLRPEDFGLPPPGEKALVSTDLSPSQYLEEAEAILETSECFDGVPRYDPKLIGLYYLNAAQLRYSLRFLKEGDEKVALTRKIRADLERARQLGSENESGDVLDLLRQVDEFEPHRARLARFRKALDNESEKD
jgi:hypothetical protein